MLYYIVLQDCLFYANKLLKLQNGNLDQRLILMKQIQKPDKYFNICFFFYCIIVKLWLKFYQFESNRYDQKVLRLKL